jgi:hypothetical protein
MAKINIIALPQFQKEIKQLIKKYISLPYDFENLLKIIEDNPTTGESLGNNCYKIRMKIASKHAGKSGGARVITCVKIINSVIYLISIYDKADRETITKKEIEAVLKNNGII